MRQSAAYPRTHPRPKCDAPAGSPRRTGGGKTAAWYHTARFILVPALREELNVVVPPDRAPGRPWGLTHNEPSRALVSRVGMARRHHDNRPPGHVRGGEHTLAVSCVRP